jgi:hypothetical protein
MAWPPPLQKNDWVNGDQQIDLHPDAHNDVANTLALDFEPQVSTNKTDIATNTADIAAHEAIYTDTGVMHLNNARLNTDLPFRNRDAAGATIGYFDGYESSGATKHTPAQTAGNATYKDMEPIVTIDMSGFIKPVVVCMTGQFIGSPGTGETLLGKMVYYATIGPERSLTTTPDSYRGQVRNVDTGGTVIQNGQTLPYWFVVDETVTDLELRMSIRGNTSGISVSDVAVTWAFFTR